MNVNQVFGQQQNPTPPVPAEPVNQDDFVYLKQQPQYQPPPEAPQFEHPQFEQAYSPPQEQSEPVTEQPVAEQPTPEQLPDDPVKTPAPASTASLPDYLRPMDEEVVFEWASPSRPFKKRNRRYFTTVVTISLLVSMILFFAGQFLPIAVVIAVAFLAYVMATIPPHLVTQQITNYGIRIENDLYYWEEFGWFWFSKKFDDTLLNIEVVRFPNRLSMVLGEAKIEDLREILSQVLMEQTPPPTVYEKTAKWLEEKIPLDID